MKVRIVMEVRGQARIRELVALWCMSQLGAEHEVLMSNGAVAGVIEFIDFSEAEVLDEPVVPRRATKRDMQEQMSVSGGRDE